MSINAAAAIALFSSIHVDKLNVELKQRGLPPQEDPNMAASLLTAGCRSQGEFAAIVINLEEGDVTTEEMAESLRIAKAVSLRIAKTVSLATPSAFITSSI